jgi:hypothetical protein
VDGAGRAIVADTYNHRIDVFRYLLPTIAPDQSGLSFGALPTGTTGSSMTVTLTNGGDGALSLSDLAITGADSGQFSRPAGAAGGTCDTATPIAPASSCTVKLVFAPTTRGAKSATLTVSGNSLDGTSSVALTGTGQGPVVAFDRGSAAFGGQATGVASSPLSVTVTNGGETALSLSAIAIGGADSAQFSRATGAAAGTCDTSTPIAAGATCTIGLVFTPATDGVKSASLSLSSDAPAGVASLPLSGTGAQPSMALDQSALAFGDEPVQSTYGVRFLTVTNTSAAQLVLTSVTLGGPDASDFWGVDSGPIGSCSGATVLAAGETCTILVIFTPRTAGAKTASVSIAGNASPTPYVVSLSGTGIQTFAAPPQELVAFPPATFDNAPSSPDDTTAAPARPRLAKAGAPSAKARGTSVRVDPGVVVACPVGNTRCVSTLTATAQIPVTGRKGRAKKVVVGRASTTTGEGGTTRIVFSLTSEGARALRNLGRLRLSVVAVTRSADGTTTRLSATVSVKRPARKKA